MSQTGAMLTSPQAFPTDDHRSHHKSWKLGSENDTIKSSSYKGQGEVRIEKQAILRFNPSMFLHTVIHFYFGADLISVISV